MNERELSVKQMKIVGTRLFGSKTIKHSDRATSGIPDITYSWGGHTFWVENKHLALGKTWKDILKTDQMVSCHELWRTTSGKSWIVVYRDSPMDTTIWFPRTLMAEAFPKVVIPDSRVLSVPTVETVCPNVWNVLETVGAVRVAGWDHQFVVRMITDYTRAR